MIGYCMLGCVFCHTAPDDRPPKPPLKGNHDPQEADGEAAGASTSSAGPAQTQDGPAKAVDGNSSAAPPMNTLQQQWAPEVEEEDEEDEDENVGQWSPMPLDAQHIGNQDVVHEDDDQRLIDLLRKQVEPTMHVCPPTVVLMY